MTTIPFLDLKAQHRALRDEILPLWGVILEQGAFIGGPHVGGLEAEFAEACGVAHAVAVGSGTDALRLIFIALGLAPGDEVITVPNTFIATTEAISQAGGRPVFVDVRPDTYNLDPGRIEAAITPRTCGIVPVHLYGQPADMDPILRIAARHGLWVVEDAAQAHLADYRGRKAGSIGTARGTGRTTRRTGRREPRRCAIAAISRGPVPQHPPTRFAPASTSRSAIDAM